MEIYAHAYYYLSLHVEYVVRIYIYLQLVDHFSLSSWKWNDISDISQAGGEENHKIKCKAEAGMFDCSMAA